MANIESLTVDTVKGMDEATRQVRIVSEKETRKKLRASFAALSHAGLDSMAQEIRKSLDTIEKNLVLLSEKAPKEATWEGSLGSEAHVLILVNVEDGSVIQRFASDEGKRGMAEGTGAYKLRRFLHEHADLYTDGLNLSEGYEVFVSYRKPRENEG